MAIKQWKAWNRNERNTQKIELFAESSPWFVRLAKPYSLTRELFENLNIKAEKFDTEDLTAENPKIIGLIPYATPRVMFKKEHLFGRISLQNFINAGHIRIFDGRVLLQEARLR